MTRFHTFRDVIDAWPSRKAFAEDIGVSLAVVHKMHEKDAIRGVYFADIVAGSIQRHGARDSVSAEDLCALAARARQPSRSEDAA